MTSLTAIEEAALWSHVDAVMCGEKPSAPLTERQQNYLLDRFRLSIAELDDLPPYERTRLAQERRANARP